MLWPLINMQSWIVEVDKAIHLTIIRHHKPISVVYVYNQQKILIPDSSPACSWFSRKAHDVFVTYDTSQAALNEWVTVLFHYMITLCSSDGHYKIVFRNNTQEPVMVDSGKILGIWDLVPPSIIGSNARAEAIVCYNTTAAMDTQATMDYTDLSLYTE